MGTDGPQSPSCPRPQPPAPQRPLQVQELLSKCSVRRTVDMEVTTAGDPTPLRALQVRATDLHTQV